MNISDPRTESVPRFLLPTARWLNDPRDVVFVWLTLRCIAVALCGVALFFLAVPWRFAAPAYWLVVFVLLIDRFTLMLHCTSHRPLFKKRYRALNTGDPLRRGSVLRPDAEYLLLPSSRHASSRREPPRGPELDDALSPRPARPLAALFFRFLLSGLFELAIYFYKRKQWKLFRRVVIGEAGFWLAMALLLAWRPMPTFVVFVAPVLAMRALMMMGNWAQHSFIVAESPKIPTIRASRASTRATTGAPSTTGTTCSIT